MKTSRKDIIRDEKDMKIPPNNSYLKYGARLKKGDLFLYKEKYTDGSFGRRLAICHGRVKPNNVIDHEEIKWYILAQVADIMLDVTYERWINPEDVIQITGLKYINRHILEFFKEKEN